MYKKIFKRLLDIIFSVILGIVLLPLILVIIIIVRFTMGSPVFFVQRRVGHKEKLFNIIKFRTMTNERDANGEYIDDAKRITKVGKLLRKSSLDELPELWCILKGDMSFIGPRPLSQYYPPYYTEEEARRHDVAPGLTGLAQVNGRNTLDWEERFKYDLEYIDNISFINDLKIFFKTIKQVIKKEDILMRGEGEVGDLDEIREVKDQNVLKGKKLLILGGSRNDIEFIRAAHEMGVKVGVTDWYSPEKSPAKLEADEYFNVSVSDIDALQNLMIENNYDGVLTGFTDSYLEFYAQLCEKGDYYCYANKKLFDIFTNKAIYKEHFKEFGVPTLPNYKISEIDENFDDYPLVLKPVDGSGGKGLQIVRNYEEYKQRLDDSIGSSKEGDVVIEPFIEDRKELTAFFIFIDGKVYYPGSGNRFLSKAQGEKTGLPVLYTIPSSYEDNFIKKVLPGMTKMCESLGVKNGIMFAQSIVKDDDIYVYDIGYRVTGSLEYKLFNKMFGMDTLKMMINYALTGNMNLYEYEDIDKQLKSDKYGVNITMLGKEGKIAEIQGREDILAMPEIIDATIKAAPGDEITKDMIGTLGQIVVRIFFTADSLDKCLDIIENVYSKIRIIDQDGNNMILDTVKREEVISEYEKYNKR